MDRYQKKKKTKVKKKVNSKIITEYGNPKRSTNYLDKPNPTFFIITVTL